MRNFWIGLVAGLVALTGFAGSASASATIDLIWQVTGTSNISGAQATSVDIVLEVILTAGPNGSFGAGVTVDYSAIFTDFAYADSLNTLGAIPISSFDDTINHYVQDVGWLNFAPGLAAGASQVLGTITFSSLLGYAGGPLTISAFVLKPGADDILDALGGTISGSTTFNVATINSPVPEPGTLSLLGMGLGGLYVVGRRSSRKR